MLDSVVRYRVPVSRVFAGAILLLITCTTHSFSQEGTLDFLLEMSGLLLLSIASLGRLWALMYISGNKTKEIIMDGPYSMVRHPLYLFSLIGAVGIGLASENFLVLALILLLYVLYYPLTIIAEERKLSHRFGVMYAAYMRRVPRFIPRLSLYQEPAVYQVKTSQFVRNFADAMWFVWIFILLTIIEELQLSGILPVLWKVP